MKGHRILRGGTVYNFTILLNCSRPANWLLINPRDIWTSTKPELSAASWSPPCREKTIFILWWCERGLPLGRAKMCFPSLLIHQEKVSSKVQTHNVSLFVHFQLVSSILFKRTSFKHTLRFSYLDCKTDTARTFWNFDIQLSASSLIRWVLRRDIAMCRSR